VQLLSEARKHQFQKCHATDNQPLDRALWCLRNWLHGTIPKIRKIRVHLSGGWLCLQMGWSPAMLICWPQKLNKNVWRDNIFEIQFAKVSDKWWRIPFHRQALREIPHEPWDPAQCRYSLPLANKWSSRDVQ
jgi:hypothetical protein